jgi:hypothetical protein
MLPTRLRLLVLLTTVALLALVTLLAVMMMPVRTRLRVTTRKPPLMLT